MNSQTKKEYTSVLLFGLIKGKNLKNSLKFAIIIKYYKNEMEKKYG